MDSLKSDDDVEAIDKDIDEIVSDNQDEKTFEEEIMKLKKCIKMILDIDNENKKTLNLIEKHY